MALQLERMPKFKTDWHETFNKNMGDIEQEFDKTAKGQFVPKPASVEEGVLYQKADGSTDVIPAFPKEQYVYGIMIDTEDPNPGAVTYTDDCRGFVPAYGSNMGSWERTALYRDIKPCVLNGGTVNYYLQKDNFNLKAEGVNVASVLTGADGHVMIEFPKLYWDFSKVGNYLYIRIGNYKFSNTAVCYAHTDGAYERDKIYIGAYKGVSTAIATDILGSTSGGTPVVSQTISTFRTAALRNGNRFHLCTFYSKMLTSILALIMYCNRDLQNVLAEGWCRHSSYAQTTGQLNSRPFCWGALEGGTVATEKGRTQMKFLGMEDYYGGIWEFCDGLVMNNYLYKATTNSALFSDTGNNFEKVLTSGLTSTANSGTYMKYVMGTNEFPFLVDGSKPNHGMLGSEITYWGDGFWFDNTAAGKEITILLFGGNWSYAGHVGPFCSALNAAPSDVNSNFGARLMFL